MPNQNVEHHDVIHEEEEEHDDKKTMRTASKVENHITPSPGPTGSRGPTQSPGMP